MAVLLSIAALLAATTSVPAHAATTGGEGDLLAGRKAALEGRYEEALGALASAIVALKASGDKDRLAEAYVYLGMAQLGLRREQEAGESLRQAVRANPRLTLSPVRFSPRMIALFRAAGGKVGEGRKKPAALLWGLSGAAAVAGPTLAYRSKKAEQDRADADYRTRRAEIERQNAEAQRAADEWNAQWARDDDGDGYSEDQGDCNDQDAAVSPDGKITPSFDFIMRGDADCTQPFAGTETVSATNHSCTAEWVSVTITGTVRWDSECTSSDPLYVLGTRVYGDYVAPGETKDLYSRSGASPLDCTCNSACHATHRFSETWTFVSSQDAVSQPRAYWYYTRTCPRCGACFR